MAYTGYGASSQLGRKEGSVVYAPNGTKYALANEHGSYCRAGFVPIETLKQCTEAAAAAGLTMQGPTEFDGTVVSRARSVPGCYLDSGLEAFGMSRASGVDSSWTEPFGVTLSQYGTDMVVFNARTVNTMDPLEQHMFNSSKSWARGRVICVERNKLVAEWDKGQFAHQSRPRFVTMATAGVGCPDTYTQVSSVRQCKEAYEAAVVNPNTLHLVTTRWVDTYNILGGDSIGIIGGCVRIVTDATVPGSRKIFQYAVNYAPKSLPLHGSAYNTQTSLNGTAVCVISEAYDPAAMPEFVPNSGGGAITSILSGTSNLVSSASSVVTAKTTMVSVTVRLELVGILSTQIADTELSLLSTTAALAIGVESDKTRAQLAPVQPDGAIPQRTAIDLYFELDRESLALTMQKADLVTRAENDSKSQFVIALQSRAAEESVDNFANIQSASFDPPDIEGTGRGYYAVSTLSVDIDSSNVLDRTMSWQSRCYCEGTEDRICHSQLDRFELRVDVAHFTEMTNDVDLLTFEPSPTSSEECFRRCAEGQLCIAVFYMETPTEHLSRCLYSKTLDTLLHVRVDSAGTVRMRAKINACPTLHIDNVELCYDGTNGRDCARISGNFNAHEPHTTVSNNPASFVASSFVGSDGTNEGRFSITPVGNVSQCWAHSMGRDVVLCADGALEPMAFTGTNDCTAPVRRNGTHPSNRARCPTNAPYMCAHRHSGETDHRCVAQPAECAVFGGVRGCGSMYYDAVGAPGFEAAPLNATAPSYTYLKEASENTQVKIGSVSRCGGVFTDAGYDHVLFDMPNCLNGFGCCLKDSDDRGANVTLDQFAESQCQCPALADPVHAAVYNGSLADTCHLPASSWPKCIGECVDAREECMYYIRNTETDECFLCHSSSAYQDAPGWEYTMPNAPLYKDSADKFQLSSLSKHCKRDSDSAMCGHTFAFHNGFSEVVDASSTTPGSWYSHVRSFIDSDDSFETCPPGYRALTTSLGFNEGTILLNCERAARAFARLTPNNVLNTQGDVYLSTVQMIDECDCSVPTGCSVFRVYGQIALRYRPKPTHCSCEGSVPMATGFEGSGLNVSVLTASVLYQLSARVPDTEICVLSVQGTRTALSPMDVVGTNGNVLEQHRRVLLFRTKDGHCFPHKAATIQTTG